MISIGSSMFGRTISKKSAIGTVLRKINLRKESQEHEKIPQQLVPSDDSVSKSTGSNLSYNEKNNLLINGHFKIRDTLVNGNMSVRKLRGLKRDSEILFVAPPPLSLPPPTKEGASSNSTLNNEDQHLYRVRNDDNISKHHKMKIL